LSNEYSGAAAGGGRGKLAGNTSNAGDGKPAGAKDEKYVGNTAKEKQNDIKHIQLNIYN